MHTCGSWLRPAEDPAPAEVIVLSEQGSGKAVWLTADGSHSTRTARWRERMTAAAIPAESDIAGHGQAVLDRVKKAEWPAGTGRQVAEALWSLHDILGIYDGILTEVIDPAAGFPELAHQDGALELALAMVAEDVSAWAAELDRLVPARGPDS
ncbi:MAG: hypothetical protein ABSA53_27995 [Streptosporangiaceae bacterium]|jgi:hypothetical protein